LPLPPLVLNGSVISPSMTRLCNTSLDQAHWGASLVIPREFIDQGASFSVGKSLHRHNEAICKRSEIDGHNKQELCVAARYGSDGRDQGRCILMLCREMDGRAQGKMQSEFCRPRR